MLTVQSAPKREIADRVRGLHPVPLFSGTKITCPGKRGRVSATKIGADIELSEGYFFLRELGLPVLAALGFAQPLGRLPDLGFSAADFAGVFPLREPPLAGASFPRPRGASLPEGAGCQP